MGLDERARCKLPRPAGCDIQHLDNRVDVFGQCEGRRHGFGRVPQQRVDRVHVEIEVIGDVGRDTAAGEPADVFERILQPREIVQVLQGRGSIQTAVQIQRLNRSAAGPEVHGVPAHHDAARRVPAVQGEDLRRLFDGLQHQRTGQQKAVSIVPRCPAGEEGRRQVVRHLPHAQRFQQPQRGFENGRQIRFAERSVDAAGLPGGAGVNLRLGGSQCHALLPTGAAGRRGLGTVTGHGGCLRDETMVLGLWPSDGLRQSSLL